MGKFIELTGAVNEEKIHIKASAITRVEFMPTKNKTAVHIYDIQKCVGVTESAEEILATLNAEILKPEKAQYNASVVIKHKEQKDMFGMLIKEGDGYFMVGNQIVHIDSMEDYFIEVLGATVHERKKPLTVGAVNGQIKSH